MSKMTNQIKNAMTYWREQRDYYLRIKDKEKAKDCQHNLDVLLQSKIMFESMEKYEEENELPDN